MFIFFDRALRSYGPLLQKMRKVFGELMVNLSQTLKQNGGKMNLLIQKEQKFWCKYVKKGLEMQTKLLIIKLESLKEF